MCQIDFFSIPDHMEVSEFTELTVTLFPNCVDRVTDERMCPRSPFLQSNRSSFHKKNPVSRQRAS